MIGKKKKLIVPVVAIMMCAVALAGVVYALGETTSVSNTENEPDSDYKVLVFSEDDGSVITSGSVADAEASNGFLVTTNTVIDTPKVVANINGPATIVVYFKMSTDAATANYSVSGTATLSTTSVTIGTAVADHKVITLAASGVTVTNVDGSAAPSPLVKDTVYKASFTITATTPADNAGIWFSDADAVTDAGAIVTALNNVGFTIALTATLA